MTDWWEERHPVNLAQALLARAEAGLPAENDFMADADRTKHLVALLGIGYALLAVAMSNQKETA